MATRRAATVYLNLEDDDDSLTVKDKGSHRPRAVNWHIDDINSWPDHPAITKGIEKAGMAKPRCSSGAGRRIGMSFAGCD